MSEQEETCRMQALSEGYFDFISNLEQDSAFNLFLEENLCTQRVSAQYTIVYAPGETTGRQMVRMLAQTPYSLLPKCYGLTDIEAISAAGIDRIQQYPGLNLSGEGVLLGVIDTGIDYRNPVFQNADGTSRIAAIWDQTEQSGTLPAGFFYGSEYTEEQINAALRAPDPYEIVPTVDENGHGTAVAAIAAGSRMEAAGFSGAAPGASIAAVKLKGAKQYLRDYYLIQEEAAAYQENDIMLAVLYLQRLSYRLSLPLVLCLALGTNQGDHAGGSPLDGILDEVNRQRMRAVVCATGNEANAGHHFEGTINSAQAYQDVEVRVGENERGFTAELWGSTPDLFAVSVISPSGEQLPRVAVGLSRFEEYTFVFEGTQVNIAYQSPESLSGDPLVCFRFQAPSAGLWRIRVYAVRDGSGAYHIWLPLTAFLRAQTYFLQSTPDMTLTAPSAAARPISVGAYDSANNSLYLASGRGYNRRGVVKPDFCAPGVSVLTVQPGRYTDDAQPLLLEGGGANVRYVRKTGTSMAAGITAGAAALLLSWAKNNRSNPLLTGVELKGYFVSGAAQSSGNVYPNPEWGYGTLDLYRTFEALRLQ